MRKILLIALPLLVIAAAALLWHHMAGVTRIALVDFQPFQAASIVKANQSRFVKYDIVDDFSKLRRYDFVLGFGMGMRITEEQRAMLQKASEKTPVYIHTATNPANAICSLDSLTLNSVQGYLDSGNKLNYQNLALFIRREIDGKRWFAPAPEPPVETVGDVLFHLDENVWFSDTASFEKYLRDKGFWQEGAPRVAIVGGLNDPFSGNRANIDSMIVGFQNAGMNVYPVSSAMQRLKFLQEINPDAVVYLPHGRVAMGAGDAAVDWLRERNIPMFAPLSMLQTRQEWEADAQGLAGGFLSQSVVMPELDGAIYPYVVNAQEIDKDGIYLFKAIPERLHNFVTIVDNFVKLKHKPNAEKRIAIYYYNGVGTLAAQGLETVPSLHNLLKRLRAEGYNVAGLPETPVAFGALLAAPRVVLGNIALQAQPPAAEGDDTFAIVHGAKTDPPQAYVDAYINDFHPDAMIHFGTHGSLEFTPGKQVALCGNDWPDRLVGTLPHFYYYTIGNVGEGMIAKRRSYATLVSYLTPPFMETGMRGQLHDLQTAITDGDNAKAQKIAVAMGLHRDLKLDSLAKWSDADINRVDDFAEEIATEKMTGALYVTGIPYSADKIRSTVMAMSADPIAFRLAAIDKQRGVPQQEGRSWFDKHYLEPAKALVVRILNGENIKQEDEELARATSNVLLYKKALEQSPELEMQSLLNALSGGYIAPSSGGDAVANPAAVPTGRNLYSINAETTPSERAWAQGVELAESTLKAYKEAHGGEYPRKVSYTFWSSEFIETEGATVAQALWMLGVEPVRDAFGRVSDLRLVHLDRPRVDVVVQTSGQFRDLAASRLALLQRAVEMAAADAGSEVHTSSVEIEKQLVEQGVPPAKARQMSTARIFGGVNGMYGTGIQAMTTAGDKWENTSEIADVYMNNMGAVYGSTADWGTFQQGLLRAVLHDADVVVQPSQSNTWGALSLDHIYEFMGGMSLAVREASGKDPDAMFADYRNRNRVRMQDLKEAIGVESRSTLFNPAFVKEVMKGGASAAAQITEMATNTYGWNVMKPAAIDPSLWERFYSVYVEDSFGLGVEKFFRSENPQALQEVSAVMLETARKGMWKATDAQLSRLSALHVNLTREFGASGMSAFNTKLQDFIAGHVSAADAASFRSQAAKGVVMKREELSSAPAPAPLANGLWIALAAAAAAVVLLIVLRKKRR